MKLSPMRFLDYVWPHNPKVYEMTYRRSIAPIKLPFGGWIMQDMGKTYRVLSGEGEFAGEKAYSQFKELAAVFERGQAGQLVHPVWQMTNALFVSLTIAEEPREDYVRYTFEFWENAEQPHAFTAVRGADIEEGAALSKSNTHTVVKGDTLWGIAASNGLTVWQLIAKNPQIKNPNLIYPGDVVNI